MYQQATTNPKALNLEGLEDERNKVTVGFKCQAHLKLTLANEAQEKGLTLSEYVETLVTTHIRNHKLMDVLATQKEEIRGLKEQVQNLEKQTHEAKAEKEEYNTRNKKQVAQIGSLQNQLSFYQDNPRLQALLAANRGMDYAYKTAEGEKRNLLIEDAKSVFTVLVDLVKLPKQ
jgi:antitoxin component of RelBE/YafQ-DinJ toxin-antitoxin module